MEEIRKEGRLIPLLSIFSPSNVPAIAVKTNVKELVIGTAKDSSIVGESFIKKKKLML